MMENFISVFVALAFLQFMRGYYASKGYSHIKNVLNWNKLIDIYAFVIFSGHLG